MSMTMTNRSPKKILIVTGDCPSHPYACCKLATVLAEHHEVTLAGKSVLVLFCRVISSVYYEILVTDLAIILPLSALFDCPFNPLTYYVTMISLSSS